MPENIAELITPRALAYWLSGDGCYHKSQGAIQISTESFSPDEVDKLRSVLLHNFHIESTRNVKNQAKEQYLIRIPKREVAKLQALVSDYMAPSMRYRVGL